MNCPQCGSQTIHRAGTSKAGKPYSGTFCTNRSCDYKEWDPRPSQQATAQSSPEATQSPQSNDKVVEGLRAIYAAISEGNEILKDIRSELFNLNEKRVDENDEVDISDVPL